MVDTSTNGSLERDIQSFTFRQSILRPWAIFVRSRFNPTDSRSAALDSKLDALLTELRTFRLGYTLRQAKARTVQVTVGVIDWNFVTRLECTIDLTWDRCEEKVVRKISLCADDTEWAENTEEDQTALQLKRVIEDVGIDVIEGFREAERVTDEQPSEVWGRLNRGLCEAAYKTARGVVESARGASGDGHGCGDIRLEHVDSELDDIEDRVAVRIQFSRGRYHGGHDAYVNVTMWLNEDGESWYVTDDQIP